MWFHKPFLQNEESTQLNQHSRGEHRQHFKPLEPETTNTHMLNETAHKHHNTGPCKLYNVMHIYQYLIWLNQYYYD